MKNNNKLLINYFEEKNKEADMKRREITSYFEFIREFFDLKDNDIEKIAINQLLEKINGGVEKETDLNLMGTMHVLLNMKNKDFFNVVIREYKSNVSYLYRLLYDIEKSIKQGKHKDEVVKLRSEMLSFLKADHEREYEEIISKNAEFIGYSEYKKVVDSLYKNFIRHYRLKYEENELKEYLKEIENIKGRLNVFNETETESPFVTSINAIFKELRKYINADKYNIDTYDFEGFKEDVVQQKKKATENLLRNLNKN